MFPKMIKKYKLKNTKKSKNQKVGQKCRNSNKLENKIINKLVQREKEDIVGESRERLKKEKSNQEGED